MHRMPEKVLPTENQTDATCSSNCRFGCMLPRVLHRSACAHERNVPENQGLQGVQLVSACIGVFLLPLLIMIAVLAVLTEPLGELTAFAVGGLVASIAMIPLAWLLRRPVRTSDS